MLNLYTPFPRYENAIFVGDTATEALAQLHIYARGLIGGDIPSMECLHPSEKMLECTHCALKHRPQILDAAARRIQADYILLEDNGHPSLNPIVMKEALEAEGFVVKTLNVQGSPEEVLLRAASLMNETKQAERVIRDLETRVAAVKRIPELLPLKVLPILGIRHPIENATYVFATTKTADLTQTIMEPLGLVNPIQEVYNELLPGLFDPNDENGWAELLKQTQPDVIALCGDATAAQCQVLTSLKELSISPTVMPLPWYCQSMGCRYGRILEIWKDALQHIGR